MFVHNKIFFEKFNAANIRIVFLGNIGKKKNLKKIFDEKNRFLEFYET